MTSTPWLRVPITELEHANGYELYKGTIFTGTAYESGSDGSGTEDEFLGGKNHGWTRAWDERGRLSREGQIYAGRKHGIHRDWYDNGQLASEDHYQYGVRLTHKAWDEQGNLTESEVIDKASARYQELLKRRAVHERIAR